jgi:hypothetical protein
MPPFLLVSLLKQNARAFLELANNNCHWHWLRFCMLMGALAIVREFSVTALPRDRDSTVDDEIVAIVYV